MDLSALEVEAGGFLVVQGQPGIPFETLQNKTSIHCVPDSHAVPWLGKTEDVSHAF